jgi:hypothetical protein
MRFHRRNFDSAEDKSMSGRNSIDSLRRLSSASDAEAATVFGTVGREQLLDLVTALPCGRPRHTRQTAPRRRLVLASVAVALVAIATAATWVVLSGAPARETTSVQCLINGNDAVIPSTSGDPAHDCAVEWRQDFGTKPPALVAYDNTHGGVTVLAGSQKPPRGWTVLKSQDVALIELQDSLDDYISGLNSSCFDAKAATSLTESSLARLGFHRWTVDVRSGTGACVGTGIVDPVAHSVTLIPMGDPTAGPETTFEKLAGKLRPLTRNCQSLPAAIVSVRAAATSLGLSASAKTYELSAVKDGSLRCASIYETVGGTIFLIVRGPGG